MQRLLEIPQEVYGFLRNFRLRAGDWNRKGGSKTAPFTHPLPGVPALLAKILILQQALALCGRDDQMRIMERLMSARECAPHIAMASSSSAFSLST